MVSQTKTFADAGAEWAVFLTREAERGERREFQAYQFGHIVDRYWIGYFGNRDLSTICDGDLYHYWDWRREYWTEGPGREIKWIDYVRGGKRIRKPITEKCRVVPSASALRTEAVMFRMFFRWAAKRSYLRDRDVPDVEIKRTPDNPRPNFSLDELNRLRRLAFSRSMAEGLNAAVKRDRQRLWLWGSILGQTGMRPAELLNLRWNAFMVLIPNIIFKMVSSL